MNTDIWPLHYRTRAAELMHDHFPDGYVIEHEGEAVVGQNVETNEEHIEGEVYSKGPFSISTGVTQTTQTTTDDKEWHIHYRSRQ